MAPHSNSTSGNLGRILIVEDEAIIADDIKLILEELDYSVVGVAASAAEAFEVAAKEKFDLALMDIRIKGQIDGIQAAEQLQERHGIPVVYLTAHTDDRTFERARATGPFGYVAKPVSTLSIKIAVAVALERHRIHSQVETRQAWLDLALNCCGVAVIIGDDEEGVSFLNAPAEEVTGIDSSTAWGKSLYDILRVVNDDGTPLPLENILASNGSDQPRFLARNLVRPDDSTQRILISVTKVPKATLRKAALAKTGAQSWCTVALISDISDHRALEHEMRDANTLLARSNGDLTFLLNSLAHDLQEPVKTVCLYSELLEHEWNVGMDAQSREYLEGIRESCERMRGLMRSLREYSKSVSLGGTSSATISADIPYREAVLNLGASIKSSQAQIQCSSLPAVQAHPTALLLVFQNLIGNAIKFAGDRIPRIHISAARSGGFWVFTIADQGLGFSPHQAESIFGLFNRGDASEGTGSGIGLAICKRLVEQHRGHIWAESTPGEGSQFHFTLPAGIKAEAADEPAGVSFSAVAGSSL